MHAPIDTQTADFIHRLPKTETHLHIEGALPYQLLQKLNPEKFSQPQRCWAPDFKWQCFEDFEAHLIEHAMHWFTSPERYHEAAKVIFAGHLDQNVRYVETSFHAGMIQFLGIPGPEIVQAIQSAVPAGLEVRVFMGMARNSYNEVLAPVLEECVTWEGLSGIDLHGVEYLPLEAWTSKLWSKARAHGLVTKAHAGEFGPAGHVREALEVLGVQRIQHGVRAIEDNSVIELAIQNDVTFDLCPISNVKLDVVDELKTHPIRQFFDRGLRCTLSTDDPFSFGNTVEDEYAALSAGLEFTHAELKQIAQNGFEVALVDERTRQGWLAEVAAT
ncbi:adenosine deaminase [Coraliomargarita sp. SDUM461004]|uniref:Adenosine deaminase n=1 Tax=Thalassobacterium sedimentorum TaxID=3041258 RepID=A0ABU1AF37_9BACT|nr:adenosine deaminase [Coraliomargarita sp. SDUM461004]MDQ8193348.1 adenosine deaminase [Coraliomargarita sp. SDUM461004]